MVPRGRLLVTRTRLPLGCGSQVAVCPRLPPTDLAGPVASGSSTRASRQRLLSAQTFVCIVMLHQQVGVATASSSASGASGSAALAASGLGSAIPAATPMPEDSGDDVLGKVNAKLYTYTEHMTIFQRFPDVPAPGGIRMVNRLLKYYQKQTTEIPQMVNNVIPWFDKATGAPNFRPHPLNVRQHDTVLDEYEESILEHGIAQDCRGRLFATMSMHPVPGKVGQFMESFPLELVTWGTLARAFYSVVQRHPSHPNVVESLAAGLDNIVVLSGRTPRDVVEFLRDFHNSFHHGASDSFIKVIQDTRIIQASWQAHCSLNNPSGHGLKEWLDRNHPQKYKSLNLYENARLIGAKLMSMSCFDDFITLFGQVVRFRDRSLSTEDVLSNLYTLCMLVEKYQATLSNDDAAKMYVYEGAKLMVPVSKMKRHKFANKRVPPQVFDKAAPSKVRWLAADMTEARIYKDFEKAAEKAEKARAEAPAAAVPGVGGADLGDEDEEPVHTASRSKAGGKAKAKNRAQAKPKPKPIAAAAAAAKSFEGDATSPVVMLPNGSTRPKVFIEELDDALELAYRNVPFKISKESKLASKSLLVSLGLEFCWAGNVTIDGEKFTDFGALRKRLMNKASFPNFIQTHRTPAGDSMAPHSLIRFGAPLRGPTFPGTQTKPWTKPGFINPARPAPTIATPLGPDLRPSNW